MVRVSDLGARILLDTRPDSEDKQTFMRQAALNPAVASEVHQRWPDGLPSDHTLVHFLMFDRGFQDDTALRVVKILRQNDSFARVSIQDDSGFSPEESPLGLSAEQTTDGGSEMNRPHDSTANTGASPAVESARSESVIDPNGLDVTIAFSGEPTQETYEFLADYIELRLKQFQRKAARLAGS